jgi:hypothetical protein
MPLPWLTVLQAVPWIEVIRNAPRLVEAARKLLNKTPPGGAPPDADKSAEPSLGELARRFDALDAQNREISRLLAGLAEQNELLVARIEANRRQMRGLWLTLGLVLLLAVLALWQAGR